MNTDEIGKPYSRKTSRLFREIKKQGLKPPQFFWDFREIRSRIFKEYEFL